MNNCDICYEDRETYAAPCTQCQKSICTECYEHVFRCPFCRFPVEGKQPIRAITMSDILLVMFVMDLVRLYDT